MERVVEDSKMWSKTYFRYTKTYYNLVCLKNYSNTVYLRIKILYRMFLYTTFLYITNLNFGWWDILSSVIFLWCSFYAALKVFLLCKEMFYVGILWSHLNHFRPMRTRVSPWYCVWNNNLRNKNINIKMFWCRIRFTAWIY